MYLSKKAKLNIEAYNVFWPHLQVASDHTKEVRGFYEKSDLQKSA